MMNTKFSLALIASAVMARSRLDTRGNNGMGAGSSEFQDYIGKFGKSYTSISEMTDRLSIWMENKKTVDDLNAKNARTGVTFGMNETSDQTEEEFLERLGLKVPLHVEEQIDNKDTSDNSGRDGGRHLQQDMSISWVD